MFNSKILQRYKRQENKITCQIKDHDSEINYICIIPDCKLNPLFCQSCYNDHFQHHVKNQILNPFTILEEFELSDFWFEPFIQLSQQIKEIAKTYDYLMYLMQKIKDPKIESYKQFNEYGNLLKQQKNIQNYLKEILPLELTNIQKQLIELQELLQVVEDENQFKNIPSSINSDINESGQPQSQFLSNKLKCIEQNNKKIFMGYENGQLIEDNKVIYEFGQPIYQIQYEKDLFIVQTDQHLYQYIQEKQNFLLIDQHLYQNKIVQKFQILTESKLVVGSFNIIFVINLGQTQTHHIEFKNNEQILSMRVNTHNSNICVLLSEGSIQMFDQNLITLQKIKKDSIARSLQFSLDQRLILIFDQKIVIFDNQEVQESIEIMRKVRIKQLYQVSNNIFLWFDADNCIYYFNRSTQKYQFISQLNSGNEKLLSYSNGIFLYYQDNNIQKFDPLNYEK